MADTNTTAAPPQPRTDDKIWSDILKLQLDGVMMHVALFESFMLKGIEGYAAMHRYHAEEEFEKYLHVAGDYMNTYKKIADMTNISQPVIQIDGTTEEEIMTKGMEAYENWEKRTCDHFKKYQSELKEGKEHVDYLINNVHEELKYIHLMENDLFDGKYKELNHWLEKKYGEH